MSEAPQLRVSARAEKALREAMKRLFTGRPARKNTALREQATKQSAAIIPLDRTHFISE